jgi:hypothetical protein
MEMISILEEAFQAMLFNLATQQSPGTVASKGLLPYPCVQQYTLL